MSAAALRDGTRSDIEDRIKTQSELLFTQVGVSAEIMRDRVAYIRGLGDAIKIMDERHRKLHA